MVVKESVKKNHDADPNVRGHSEAEESNEMSNHVKMESVVIEKP